MAAPMPCNFPAAKLLAYRDELIGMAEKLRPEDSTLRDVMDSLLQIDRLRINHEAISGCGCWYEAVKGKGMALVR